MDEVVTYEQLPIEQPEAFRKTINSALFKLLRMKKIDVVFVDMENSGWAGFCLDASYSQSGEIAINTYLVKERIRKPRPRLILSTYLHEAAHRLCPEQGHNSIFFAMNLLLFLRAEPHLADMWHGMSLYDLQDETDIPGSFNFAFNLAHEYAGSDVSAEDCLPIFVEKYIAWLEWNAGSGQRENNVKLKWRRLNNMVSELKFQRWVFGIGGLGIGFLFSTLFIFLIRYHSQV